MIPQFCTQNLNNGGGPWLLFLWSDIERLEVQLGEQESVQVQRGLQTGVSGLTL
jgi:hypothetical protein